MPRLPKKLIWAIILVAFIGFLDATYLTATHYGTVPLICGENSGCDTVTTSQYSTVFGIPVALGGALYYFAVLFLSLLYVDRKKSIVLSIIPPFTVVGVLASGWFVYIQLFVLNAICYYCMLSATTSALLFILGIALHRYRKKLT